MSSKQHIVIIRSGGSIIDFNSYNCQELGLAKALTDKGFKTSIITAGTSNELTLIPHGSEQIGVYSRKFRSLNQALAWFDGIERLLEEINPDVIQIHEFGMLMSWRILRWSKRNAIPTFLIQGSYKPTAKPIFRQLEILFNRTFGKYILNNVSGIGCKTVSAANYVAKYTKRTVVATPVGLDVSKFRDASQIEWRKNLGIKSEDKVLLYVGKLEKRRNPMLLIDILSDLPDDYTLIIAGDGPLSKEIGDRIVSEGLQNRCFLLGKLQQHQLPSLYTLADMFLLASDYEIYGMVILEAMYFGLTVISTPTAGAETLIDNKQTGVIIGNTDSKTWANKIMELSVGNTLNQIGQNASRKVKEHLLWDKAADNFVNLYFPDSNKKRNLW